MRFNAHNASTVKGCLPEADDELRRAAIEEFRGVE
jgi:hypothetical protein